MPLVLLQAQLSMHAGVRIGAYEITIPLGAGGMGEVFRARDTRLNRDVAIKVLPKDFAGDADRLRRFEQEAKTLAALNHPNVLTIHDAGVHDHAPYLVSELLEGRTLRDEMKSGALPVRKATEYALQIAHGLAAAHGKGIIHRDLKPENIFVTKDGRVKILDFGLAKLKEPSSQPSSVGRERQNDPAATIHTTEPGMVVGTPAYMSPEQVRGEPADHRADIFAFGCVLYEMLSGSRAFRRDTPVASMNAVLSEEPHSLSATNSSISPGLERIIQRCLEKEPDNRFQSAKDLAFAIESVGPASPAAHLAQHTHRAPLLRFLPWVVAALAIIAAIGTFIAAQRASSPSRIASRASAAPPVLRKTELRIPLPIKKNVGPRLTGMSISPDGGKLAYANADGLWVRPLDQLLPPILLSSGRRISMPFWSPRSTDVAWFEDGSLKRAPASGGRVLTICRVNAEIGPTDSEGGAWLANDEIIFATGNRGLDRVPAQGGIAKPALVPAEDELDYHRVSPLPDGQSVVFVIHRKEGSLTPIDTLAIWTSKNLKPAKRILFQRPSSHLSRPVFSTSGHIIFHERNPQLDESLWALPVSSSAFEPTGEPFRLADIGAFASSSADGTLALLQGQAVAAQFAPRQLVWVERSGRIGVPFGPVQKGLSFPRLSPDERFVAFSAGEERQSQRLWVLDLAAGNAFPLRLDGEFESNPYWLPNGRDLVVTAARSNRVMTVIRGVEGDRPTEDISPGVPLHVSPSGEYAFLRQGLRAAPVVTNFYVRLSGDRSQRILLPRSSPNLVDVPRLRLSLSPDDKILAFQSNETDPGEIWVVAFPSFTNRVLVSRGGGRNPQWSRDGKDLFYVSNDGFALMSAPVVNQNGRIFGAPVKLFDLPASIFAGELPALFTVLFDVSADGQRFLMMQNVKEPNAPESELGPRVLLIQNWFEEYREKK